MYLSGIYALVYGLLGVSVRSGHAKTSIPRGVLSGVSSGQPWASWPSSDLTSRHSDSLLHCALGDRHWRTRDRRRGSFARGVKEGMGAHTRGSRLRRVRSVAHRRAQTRVRWRSCMRSAPTPPCSGCWSCLRLRDSQFRRQGYERSQRHRIAAALGIAYARPGRVRQCGFTASTCELRVCT